VLGESGLKGVGSRVSRESKGFRRKPCRQRSQDTARCTGIALVRGLTIDCCGTHQCLASSCHVNAPSRACLHGKSRRAMSHKSPNSLAPPLMAILVARGFGVRGGARAQLKRACARTRTLLSDSGHRTPPKTQNPPLP
jgi:hypothetical protein